MSWLNIISSIMKFLNFIYTDKFCFVPIFYSFLYYFNTGYGHKKYFFCQRKCGPFALISKDIVLEDESEALYWYSINEISNDIKIHI